MAIFCLNKMRAQPFSRKLGLFCEVVFMWLHAFHVACGVSDFMCFMWLHAFHVFGLWWQGVEFHGFHVVSCVSCGFMCLRLGVASRINCIIFTPSTGPTTMGLEIFKNLRGWELIPPPVSHPRCIKKGPEVGANTDSSHTLFF